MLKKILWALFAIFICIQFFRSPRKNVSSALSDNDITRHYLVPDKVIHILQKACYDCHSNNTTYPWYYNIQPLGWWLNDHIEEGKHHLNFSEFGSYPLKKADHKLEDLADAVTNHWMPLKPYRWLHSKARLSTEETKWIADWANELRKQLQVKMQAQSDPAKK